MSDLMECPNCDPQITPMTTTAPMPAVEPLSEDISPRERVFEALCEFARSMDNTGNRDFTIGTLYGMAETLREWARGFAKQADQMWEGSRERPRRGC
jgi:hypothetical protein